MSPLSQRALDRAIGQIDQKENPLNSNWGHPVQDYLASVGINFPASWCMAFIYWCFDGAANQLGLINPMIKTGGVLPQWHGSSALHQIKFNPQAGDIFIMDLGHGLGHTGIIESIDSIGLRTIEGNTNDTGGREGIEVARRLRKPGLPIIGYLRF